MTPEFYKLKRLLTGGLKKHHVVLFATFLGAMLSVAIFLMYETTQSTFVIPDVTSSTIQDFDQKTIQKIKNLHDSSANTTITLPSPRSNPFTE